MKSVIQRKGSGLLDSYLDQKSEKDEGLNDVRISQHASPQPAREKERANKRKNACKATATSMVMPSGTKNMLASSMRKSQNVEKTAKNRRTSSSITRRGS